jgi:hypothetical protein
VLRFLYCGARESDRGGRRPPSGLGRSRWEMTPEWADVGCTGQQPSWAGARFSGRERKGWCSGLSWAKRPD